MNATVPYSEQPHPPTRHSPASAFALGAGSFLLVEGLWGLASPVVFGLLTTNRLHAVVHLVLGVYGISVGLGRQPKGYLLFLGMLLMAVGALHFVPSMAELLWTLLHVNTPVAIVNLAVGGIALVVRIFHWQ